MGSLKFKSIGGKDMTSVRVDIDMQDVFEELTTDEILECLSIADILAYLKGKQHHPVVRAWLQDLADESLKGKPVQFQKYLLGELNIIEEMELEAAVSA